MISAQRDFSVEKTRSAKTGITKRSANVRAATRRYKEIQPTVKVRPIFFSYFLFLAHWNCLSAVFQDLWGKLLWNPDKECLMTELPQLSSVQIWNSWCWWWQHWKNIAITAFFHLFLSKNEPVSTSASSCSVNSLRRCFSEFHLYLYILHC